MATTIQQIETPKRARALDTSSGWQVVSGNLITNGDFATGDFTGWSDTLSNGGAKSIVSGAARLDGSDNASTVVQIYQNILTEGKSYRVTFDITNHTPDGDNTWTRVINNSGALLYRITGNGTGITFDFTHNIAAAGIFFRADGENKMDIDNIVVQELRYFPNNNYGQLYSGRALEFDGVTDYFQHNGGTNITGVNTFDDGSPWTFACWMYFNSNTTTEVYFVGEDEDTKPHLLKTNDSSGVELRFREDST